MIWWLLCHLTTYRMVDMAAITIDDDWILFDSFIIHSFLPSFIHERTPRDPSVPDGTRNKTGTGHYFTGYQADIGGHRRTLADMFVTGLISCSGNNAH